MVSKSIHLILVCALVFLHQVAGSGDNLPKSKNSIGDLILVITLRSQEMNGTKSLTGLWESPALLETLGSKPELTNGGKKLIVPSPGSSIIGSKEFPCIYDSGDVERLIDAVTRVLNFFESHLTEMLEVSNAVDPAIGLAVFEGQLQHLLQAHPNIRSTYTTSLQNLLQRCEKISKEYLDVVESRVYGEIKEKLLIIRKNLQTVWTGQNGSWKNYDEILDSKYINAFPNLGNEKDSIWPTLNVECLTAVQDDCRIPYICDKLYLNNNEQSQYTLTHQIIYLNIIQKKSCAQKHSIKLQKWEESREELCAKAYKEAELIASYGVPPSHRDIFSEYVMTCGLAGYPNFLRKDWLNEILSWQSKSEYGCFLEQYKGTPMITSDVPVARLPVRDEVNPTGEKCLPHFTTVALSALSLHLGRLFDVCPALH